jgi:Tol biopolymer transport system component/C-terminal processing protease CtpA/Prc
MKSLLSTLSLFLSISLFAQVEPAWLRFPAVSPDGNTVAFCYQGDIYTIGINGGIATPITISDAYDKQPVWSPDGKMIAFSSDRHGNFDVFVVPATGGSATRLTYHSAGDTPSDFTPDGKNIIFTSARMDMASNQEFPTGGLPELYSVPVAGGREIQLLTTTAHLAKYNSKGDMIVYQDQKGYEDDFRKHHTSSVTRDIWTYSFTTKEYTKISTFNGEDLEPVFAKDDNTVYYLSEQGGTMNIYKTQIGTRASTPITSMKDHPVRSISISDAGLLCFVHHGIIYTQKEGEAPKALRVQIAQDSRYTAEKIVPVAGATDFDLSPNGKEFAFIYRGEVFVSSVAEGTTKRITNTPEQERNVDFSPDGRSIVYSSERNNSWNIYTSTIERKEELYFFSATLIKEEGICVGPEETFQPSYSPTGEEIAFLEERTALKVINLKSKAVRTIVPAERNYSYADGDQHYDWSPDGKWFLVNYLPGEQWISQMGLVSADGKGEIKNLSNSGFGANGPSWMMGGKMAIWNSSYDGLKSRGSWGAQSDIYASFFSQEAYDLFKLTEEEFELYKEEKAKEEEEKAKKEEASASDSKKKKESAEDKKKKDEKTPEIKPLELELEGFDDRKVRLTIHSSNLTDAYVTKDGSKLLYLTEIEKGFDLWQTDLRTKETKILAKLGTGYAGMQADTSDKFLYIISSGMVTKVDIATGEPKPLSMKGEMVLNENAERAYLFEHIWRQVQKKFYLKNLHNVRWDFYKEEYAKKVGAVNNNYDFADMMGEMLGELNASHTGAFYWSPSENGDQTATLGFFFKEGYTGNGLMIEEVLDKNPIITKESKIKAGVVIEKIDGTAITPNTNYYSLLNRKGGKNTLLHLFNPKSGERWEEIVKPFGYGLQNELLYQRWVKNCEHIVDSLSGGTIGYVHVRGMDDGSFRKVYDQALGKHAFKKALVVDTRYNGGGWLHDDLATFLGGKPYLEMTPRDQKLGKEPMFKWAKPSVVVMNESNYSDAHLFPYVYKELGVGKLMGMPVPGTGTAVWWEGLQNGVVFGIPQVGMVNDKGQYLENLQLEPDVRVENAPAIVSKGRDQQLEKAVQELQK